MKAQIKFRLGDALQSDGLISAAQLEQALAEQKKTGRRLGRVLSDLGFASDEAIAAVISKQLRIPFIDLRRQTLDPALVRLLPEAQARRFRAVVLQRDPDGLLVGFADPTDVFAQDEVARVLRTPLQPAVVTERNLLAAIDRVYQNNEELSSLASEVAADIGVETVASLDVPSGSDDAPIVRLLQTIFDAALTRSASDIHVEPQEKDLTIRFRVDGVLQLQSRYDSKIGAAIVQRLKLMSHLDISEKRLPQDGRFQVRTGGTVIDVRISTLPVQHGESLVMRLLVQNTERARLDDIGLPPTILTRLRAALGAASGLVLVTGPTGSGKTTTLYAALAELNTTQAKIITVEDPVEVRMPGLNQVQVHEKIDLSFARVLRSCLRQDPDVLLVGEMRDQETAEIGLRAALTGHLVLSTLHTNDAAGAALRLVDMGIAPYMVGLGLRMVIAQRLVRLICPHCKAPHRPNAQEREWLAMVGLAQADAAPFYAGTGCNHCHDTGYRGRIGLYEMLEMTPELVHAASHGELDAFTHIAHEQFADHRLHVDALRQVCAGRTTLAEAMRIGAPKPVASRQAPRGGQESSGAAQRFLETGKS